MIQPVTKLSFSTSYVTGERIMYVISPAWKAWRADPRIHDLVLSSAERMPAKISIIKTMMATEIEVAIVPISKIISSCRPQAHVPRL